MNFWDSIWNVIWLFFWSFAFIAYLFALFAVIGDLFRDHKLNGWMKALWIIFMIFIPFLTVLVYLIARGSGMAERQAQLAQRAQRETEGYIKTVAGQSSSADEIAKAKALLDDGTITAAEFEQLKAHALAHPRADHAAANPPSGSGPASGSGGGMGSTPTTGASA